METQRVIAGSSTRSWQIVEIMGEESIEKTEFHGVRRSGFWLLNGYDPNCIYGDPAIRGPFTEAHSGKEAVDFLNGLTNMLVWFDGKFSASQEPGDAVTITGSYVDQKRGRASVVITGNAEMCHAKHLWQTVDGRRD